MKPKDLNAVMAVFFGIAFALLLQNLFGENGIACGIQGIYELLDFEDSKLYRLLIALNLGIFLVKYFIDDIVNASNTASVTDTNGIIITSLILAWTCFMIACASVGEKTCVLIPLFFWLSGMFLIQRALKNYIKEIGNKPEMKKEYETAKGFRRKNWWCIGIIFVYGVLILIDLFISNGLLKTVSAVLATVSFFICLIICCINRSLRSQ